MLLSTSWILFYLGRQMSKVWSKPMHVKNFELCALTHLKINLIFFGEKKKNLFLTKRNKIFSHLHGVNFYREILYFSTCKLTFFFLMQLSRAGIDWDVKICFPTFFKLAFVMLQLCHQKIFFLFRSCTCHIIPVSLFSQISFFTWTEGGGGRKPVCTFSPITVSRLAIN